MWTHIETGLSIVASVITILAAIISIGTWIARHMSNAHSAPPAAPGRHTSPATVPTSGVATREQQWRPSYPWLCVQLLLCIALIMTPVVIRGNTSLVILIDLLGWLWLILVGISATDLADHLADRGFSGAPPRWVDYLHTTGVGAFTGLGVGIGIPFCANVAAIPTNKPPLSVAVLVVGGIGVGIAGLCFLAWIALVIAFALAGPRAKNA